MALAGAAEVKQVSDDESVRLYRFTACLVSARSDSCSEEARGGGGGGRRRRSSTSRSSISGSSSNSNS